MSVLVCTLGVLDGWCARAGAQERERVIVLQPADPTPLEHELLTRLTGELGAAGIEVLRLPLAPGTDAQLAVGTQGSELSAVAAFATREERAAGPGSPSSPTLRLWFSDRVTGTLLAEDARDVDRSSMASSLAVQGFELLQARQAEWRWRPRPAPAPKVVVAPRVVPAPVASLGSELTAGIHVGLLFDAPSGGAALTPMARVSYEPALTREVDHFDFGARLSVAGFGAPTVLEASDRQVDVVQSFALLEGVVTFDPGGWLHPFGSGGAGAYHVNVNGVGSVSAVGRSEGTLSPLASAGLGLAAQPWRHWVGVLEAQGLFALHPTAVEAGGTRAATFGRALLVFSFGLGVTW